MAPRLPINAVAPTGLRSRIVDALLGGGAATLVAPVVEKVVGGVAPQPTELGVPQPTTGKGAGFIRSAADYADYVRAYQQEAYNRALASAVPGVGQAIVEKLPPMLTPEQFFELQYSQAEAAAEGMSERERALAALRGQLDIEKVKQEKIGDIEREKVTQGYGLARGVLESAIENILAKPNLAGSPVLTEAARAY